MPPRPVPRLTAGDRLALAAILALAFALRLREAAGAPFWFDEIYTLWTTRLPWDAMLAAVAHDIHPPLHFVLLKAWRALGGENEAWVRGLSIAAGLGTIGAIAALGRDAFGRGAGMLAGLLLAVHLVHIGVSSEARFYELMGLCVWAAAFAAHRWVARGGAGAAVLLVAALTAGTYTHYLTGLVWALLFGWGLAALRREPRRLLHWAGLFAAAFALFLPQLPTFVAQLGRHSGSHWIGPPDLEDLATLVRRVAFGAWYLVPAAVALAALPFARRDGRRAAWLVLVLAAGTTLATWALTRLGAHMFTARYMFFIVPGGCLLLAAGISGLASRRLAIALAAAFALLGLRTAWIKPLGAESTGLREIREAVLRDVPPGEPLVCGDTHTLAFLRHYGSPTPPWMALPGDSLPYWEGAVVLDPAWIRPLRAVDTLAASGRRWWFVRQRTGGIDTRPTLARVVAAGGEPVAVATRDSIALWRVDAAPAPAPR